MVRIIILFFSAVWWCCSREGIPAVCEDLGYEPNPVKFTEGFYMQGILNGKPWSADYAGYSLVHNGIYFREYNKCGLVKYLANFSHFKFVNSTQDLTKAELYYNYGQIDEVVLSQTYDSLVTTSRFKNTLIFDYIAPDTAVVEGRFQFHLTKSVCFYYSDGSLGGCRPPDYLDGEPKDIIITDGKFRLKRTQ